MTMTMNDVNANMNMNKQITPFSYHENTSRKKNLNIDNKKENGYNIKNKSKEKLMDRSKDKMGNINIDKSIIGMKIKQKVKLNVDVRKLLQSKTHTFTNNGNMNQK